MSTNGESRPGPLFIVGSPRSGTSILVDAAFAAGLKGFREGNFFGLLRVLQDQTDMYFRRFSTDNPKVLMAHLGPEVVHRALQEFFRQTVDRLNPESPWVDKTCNSPTVLLLPDLITLWPDCRIIFAKRRGIENIRSRLIKFPERDFAYHAHDWAFTMSAWRAVRARLEPWRYREIDQRDLIERPKEIAAQIAELLSLDSAAEARIVNTFVTLRPQQTAPGTAEAIASLDDGRWSESEVEEFLRTCGQEMECFGYALDGSYRRSAADSSAR